MVNRKMLNKSWFSVCHIETNFLESKLQKKLLKVENMKNYSLKGQIDSLIA